MTAESPVAEAYAERREHDWNAFVRERGTLADYWARWETRSRGWRVPIDFLQPVGMEMPTAFEPLEPLFEQLRALPGIEVPPVEWLHITWVRVGFLMADDVMWSQVETFYVNAAPRLRRVPPFSIRLGGLSVAEGDRVYLGVDDGGSYREARRQAKLGVPKVYEVLRDDPLVTDSGDAYMPMIEVAHFTGGGDRDRLVSALEPYREVEVGVVPLTHLKLARVPILPYNHYEALDVVAEIPMLGEGHRGGYHN